jgi:hypothetical protein
MGDHKARVVPNRKKTAPSPPNNTRKYLLGKQLRDPTAIRDNTSARGHGLVNLTMAPGFVGFGFWVGFASRKKNGPTVPRKNGVTRKGVDNPHTRYLFSPSK